MPQEKQEEQQPSSPESIKSFPLYEFLPEIYSYDGIIKEEKLVSPPSNLYLSLTSFELRKAQAKAKRKALMNKRTALRRKSSQHKERRNVSAEEEEKKEIRRVKNREAAALSRKRNRERFKELEDRIEELQERNAYLEKRVVELQTQPSCWCTSTLECLSPESTELETTAFCCSPFITTFKCGKTRRNFINISRKMERVSFCSVALLVLIKWKLFVQFADCIFFCD